MRTKTLSRLLLVLVLLPGAVLAQGADFTRYVAVGDSLTAGFSSGGLVRTVQNSSYPALLFRQARGQQGGFEQPLVTEPGIPAALELRSLLPVPTIGPKPGLGQPANLNLQRPYDNLAVPGARVHDVVARVTDNGGLHDLILRGLGTQLQQAAALRPTFATVWIGNNDVLAAATSGIVIEGVTLTPVAAFEADLRAIASTLAGVGARLAFANIPDVTSIAFVTAIPPVVVNPATSQPVLVGGNPVPLIGPNGPLGGADRVLLTASALLAQGIGIPAGLGGTGQPLPDSVVLSAAEIATIAARVNAYNTLIRTVAQERNAALVDFNALLRELATTGVRVGGLTYTAAFLTGGIFSYDGVHPERFGYAFVANAFIEAINDHYDDDIPLVDLYPFVFGPSVAGDAELSSFVGFVFTAEAERNLRFALNVPSDEELKKAKDPRRKPPRRRRGGRG